ncbi:TPA: hypothetical protein ACGO35_000330 [Streptococcus suis]
MTKKTLDDIFPLLTKPQLYILDDFTSTIYHLECLTVASQFPKTLKGQYDKYREEMEKVHDDYIEHLITMYTEDRDYITKDCTMDKLNPVTERQVPLHYILQLQGYQNTWKELDFFVKHESYPEAKRKFYREQQKVVEELNNEFVDYLETICGDLL